MKLTKMAGKIGVTAVAAVAAATVWGSGVARADSRWQEINTGNTFYDDGIFPGLPKCLALNAGDGFYNNNTRVFQWDCNDNNDQQWSTHFYGYTPSGQKLWQIINLQSRQCMEVRNANTSNGTQVDQFPCGNGSIDSISNQLWVASPVSGRTGTSTLNPWSALRVGVQMCLDVWNSDDSNGTKVEQWTCNGGNNQQFVLGVV